MIKVKFLISLLFCWLEFLFLFFRNVGARSSGNPCVGVGVHTGSVQDAGHLDLARRLVRLT